MSTAVLEPHSRGRVLTEATIENLEDLWAAKRGLFSPEEVRRSIVPDALVDTGATLLSLPRKLIAQLGLARTGTKRVTVGWAVPITHEQLWWAQPTLRHRLSGQWSQSAAARAGRA